jgi:hypothetical protein
VISRVRRRALLQSVAVGLAGFGGCAALEESESGAPRLVDLTALNYDDEPHTFHVRMELDGETTYRESKRVKAAGPDDPRGAVFTGYPEESESYVVSMWRDDQPETEARTLDFAEFDSECLGVEVKLGTYGESDDEPDLSIFYTSNCAAGQ